MIIVGFTGAIGSGKTTFADFLAEQFEYAGHWESWQLIAEVAEALRAKRPHPDPSNIAAVNRWLKPLPGIIARTCHREVAFDTLALQVDVNKQAPEYSKLFQYLELVQGRPELAEGPIDEGRKEDLRSILQWLGGYLAATCGGDIWYAEIIRRIQADPKLELATIGGVRFPADAACIKKAVGLIIAIDRRDWQARDTADPTERERNQVPVDITIYNDGDLQQLRQCAQVLAADLKAGRHSAQYRSSKL